MGIETADAGTEDVEAFRLRARAWLADNMPRTRRGPEQQPTDGGSTRWKFAAGSCSASFSMAPSPDCVFPRNTGDRDSRVRIRSPSPRRRRPTRCPSPLNIPTFSILAPTLLDYGTEEQKRAHLPKMISGEEIWVQFLSEPSGGSDLASLVTRATRDGDVFILNGSKIWSSGAFRCDYAMCLARTDWHAPKHRGLTMFILKIHQPGIDIQQIKMLERPPMSSVRNSSTMSPYRSRM